MAGILRTNRLIVMANRRARGIIANVHAPLGMDLGAAEPDACSAGQHIHCFSDRSPRLVDEAILFPGIPVSVPDHAGGRFFAALGDRHRWSGVRSAK